MSSLAAWVLAALLALPVSKHDRDVETSVKRAQLETVAVAIAAAATATKWPGDPRELAGLLIVVAKYESGFALRVHAGNCLPHECDKGRARGIWQQQATSTSTRAAWFRIAGLDDESTHFAAREAARALARSRWMCRTMERPGADWATMTITAYAGRGCSGWFSGLERRKVTFRRLMGVH